MQRGCSGEAHRKGIKIFKHLPPGAVNRAVAFVYDSDIEELRRQRVAVAHGDGRLPEGAGSFERGAFLILLGQLRLARQDGIKALDGRDDNAVDRLETVLAREGEVV